MDNVVKQTELLEKTGVYDEDLMRRFALTLKYNGTKGKKNTCYRYESCVKQYTGI